MHGFYTIFRACNTCETFIHVLSGWTAICFVKVNIEIKNNIVHSTDSLSSSGDILTTCITRY